MTVSVPSGRVVTRRGMSRVAFAVAAGLLISCPDARSEPPARLAVLAPSVAEIVVELGEGGRIAAACDQCVDAAPSLATLPRVGSYVTPSVEAVVAARPDLVLVVPSPGNRDAVRQLERLGLPVLVVRDRTLADLWDGIEAIAARIGVPKAGARLVGRIRHALQNVEKAVQDRPRPSVLLAVGRRPLIVAGRGTLQDELLRIAGAENAAQALGEAWPTMSLETLVRDPPDVIIDAAMGDEAGRGGLLPPSLVGSGAPRIVRVPIDPLVRAGPGVAEAAWMLARELHPGLSK